MAYFVVHPCGWGASGLNKQNYWPGFRTRPAASAPPIDWLKHQSGLGELIGCVFEAMNPQQLHRVSDRLLKHKAALESFLYARGRTLFDFEEVIALYDLYLAVESICTRAGWLAGR